MGKVNIQLNGEYGDGARQTPNPDWEAWESTRQSIQSRLDGMQGPGMEGQRLAIEQDLQRHMAGQPPPFIDTHLGGATNAIEQQGNTAVSNIQQGKEDIRTVGDDAFQQGQGVATDLAGQGAAAQGRQAPTINVPAGGRVEQQNAGAAAAGFQAPDAATNVAQTANYYAQNVANTANNQSQNVAGFRANDAGAAGIRNAGVEATRALQKFASGPTGPSAAEAMLRLQAARDKAAALSRARSARGGPGAVNEALKGAQAEGAAMAADTRGQLATVRAQEAAQRRGEQLTALTQAGQLNLAGQQAATGAELQGSGLNLQGATSAAGLALQGAQGAGELATQGAQAAGQLQLGASGQNLQAIQIRGDIANSVRGMDIDTAKSQLSAELQTMSLNDEQTRFFAGLSEQARQDANQARADATARGIDADVAAAQVGLQYANQVWQMLTADQQSELQEAAMRAGVVTQQNQNHAQQQQAVLGMIGGGLTAGAMVAKSDRRAKRDIRKLRSMADALRKTPGSSYRYKLERDGKGRFTGPMAQDLERTAEFRSAVREIGGVKHVDAARLTLSHHAALSDLQRQIDRLEKLGRKKKRDEPDTESAEA